MKQPSLKLRKKIKKTRPSLSDISIDSYITSLRMLYAQYIDNDETKLSEQLSTKFLHNFSDIKKLIEMCRTTNTQKNRLTAILVSLSAEKNPDDKLIERYQVWLKDIMRSHQKDLDSQEKTKTQSDNWMTMDEVRSVLNKMMSDIKDKDILNRKKKLTKGQYNLLQKYVLLYFYVKYPIRNDVANTRVISPSEYEKDPRKDANYLVWDKDTGKMVFKLNVFKNVARIGPKSIDISPNVARILKKWFKVNSSGWFFTLSNGIESLSPNGVTKLLNSIFKEYGHGKKISTSMLRHIQISEDLATEETISEKKAKEMAIQDKYQHSGAVHDQYRKIDEK